MKVVVFGGSGFLGSHVADVLTDRGYDVIIFDRINSPYLQDSQKMVQGDFFDFDQVSYIVDGCDYVYNFAGISDIDEARQDPIATIKSNVLGNTHIIEASRLAKVKRFIFASSVYVYTDLASFYRSSKQACELIIEDYQKTFGLDFTILRYGSLYGRRANNLNFITKIIKQAIETGQITRKGNGEEIREYIHVMDAARCSVDILGDEFQNQHVIITGTQSIKVKNLLEMVKEIFKGKIKIEYLPQDDLHYRYTITPYTFQPKLAKKLVLSQHHDLGQGILDVIHATYQKSVEADGSFDKVENSIDVPQLDIP